jgi:hypothetical protein
MATLITAAGPILIQARLLTILLVNHGTGGDLSVTGQVVFGDYPDPSIQEGRCFLAIGAPELEIRMGGDLPLNQYEYTMRTPIEGWAPVTASTSGEALGRMVAAEQLLDHVVGAIQEDFATDTGSSTLFDLLAAVPAFENVKIHRSSVHDGQAYGRFTFDFVAVYRRTSGV